MTFGESWNNRDLAYVMPRGFESILPLTSFIVYAPGDEIIHEARITTFLSISGFLAAALCCSVR